MSPVVARRSLLLRSEGCAEAVVQRGALGARGAPPGWNSDLGCRHLPCAPDERIARTGVRAEDVARSQTFRLINPVPLPLVPLVASL